MAASVSPFITSVFSGSRTEPVSRKRTMSVPADTMATTSGAFERRLAFWSRKRAVLPATSTSAPRGSGRSRIARTASCERSDSAGASRARFVKACRRRARNGGTRSTPSMRRSRRSNVASASGLARPRTATVTASDTSRG